ncbi:carbamoyltransferase C-terminal domain-containing protein [Candidatus Nitrospira nitrificans]
MISQLKQQTGCGIIINTSFNVRGEPDCDDGGGCIPLLYDDGR